MPMPQRSDEANVCLELGTSVTRAEIDAALSTPERASANGLLVARLTRVARRLTWALILWATTLVAFLSEQPAGWIVGVAAVYTTAKAVALAFEAVTRQHAP
jgi:hypothetical protein